MKTKTYIFLFFIALSQFAFGQDSLLVKKANEFPHNLVSGIDFTKTKIDTITFYNTKIINSYILNKSEKDSIYKSYIKKNRKFLKPYRKDWKKLISTKYPDNPHLRNLLFFCLMNTNKIDNNSKNELFFEKFRKDWYYCYRTDCLESKPKYDESKIYYSSRKGIPFRVKWEKKTNYVHSKQIAINQLVGRIEDWKSNLYKLRPYIFMEVENDDFIVKNHTVDNDIEIHNINEKITDIEILGLEILNKEEEVERLLNLQLKAEKNLIIYYKKK